jgi:hypothetical protein
MAGIREGVQGRTMPQTHDVTEAMTLPFLGSVSTMILFLLNCS